MAVNQSVCGIKTGLFSTCKGAPAGICQYCGRPFCQEHGIFLELGQEVCHRPNCVAKREDVARHLVYKEAVIIRNEARHCGVEGCNHSVVGRCSRCEGYFCDGHVGPREDVIIENDVKIQRLATLCRHCFERRPIWLRT